MLEVPIGSRGDKTARAPLCRTLCMHYELRVAELESTPAANCMGTVVHDTQKRAHRVVRHGRLESQAHGRKSAPELPVFRHSSRVPWPSADLHRSEFHAH